MSVLIRSWAYCFPWSFRKSITRFGFSFFFPSFGGNEVGEGPQMNIKGYLLGNPLTDTNGDCNSRIQYAHRMALLSGAIYKSFEENCNGEYWKIDTNNSLCTQAIQVVDKCIGRIRLSNILEPHCDTSNTLKLDLFRRALGALDKSFMPLPQVQKQSCRDDNYVCSNIWANNRDVREALHVREEFGDMEWVRCNDNFYFYFDKEPISYTHDVLSTVFYHRRLSNKHCRALIYRYTMKYSKDNYHLTFATVKGGGHTAPEYKPKECLSMLMRWLADDSI